MQNKNRLNKYTLFTAIFCYGIPIAAYASTIGPDGWLVLLSIVFSVYAGMNSVFAIIIWALRKLFSSVIVATSLSVIIGYGLLWVLKFAGLKFVGWNGLVYPLRYLPTEASGSFLFLFWETLILLMWVVVYLSLSKFGRHAQFTFSKSTVFLAIIAVTLTGAIHYYADKATLARAVQIGNCAWTMSPNSESQCYESLAKRYNTIQQCSRIPQQGQYRQLIIDCYKRIVQSTQKDNKISVCMQIMDRNDRNQCLLGIVETVQDPRICEQYLEFDPGSSKRQDLGNCYYSLAKATGNSVYCNRIDRDERVYENSGSTSVAKQDVCLSETTKKNPSSR